MSGDASAAAQTDSGVAAAEVKTKECQKLEPAPPSPESTLHFGLTSPRKRLQDVDLETREEHEAWVIEFCIEADTYFNDFAGLNREGRLAAIERTWPGFIESKQAKRDCS